MQINIHSIKGVRPSLTLVCNDPVIIQRVLASLGLNEGDLTWASQGGSTEAVGFLTEEQMIDLADV